MMKTAAIYAVMTGVASVDTPRQQHVIPGRVTTARRHRPARVPGDVFVVGLRPPTRATQHSATVVKSSNVTAYWAPAFAGVTAVLG